MIFLVSFSRKTHFGVSKIVQISVSLIIKRRKSANGASQPTVVANSELKLNDGRELQLSLPTGVLYHKTMLTI